MKLWTFFISFVCFLCIELWFLKELIYRLGGVQTLKYDIFTQMMLYVFIKLPHCYWLCKSIYAYLLNIQGFIKKKPHSVIYESNMLVFYLHDIQEIALLWHIPRFK